MSARRWAALSRKRAIIVASILALVCAVGVRIYFVNANATAIEVEHYGMGEWVDLDGAFIYKRDIENTQGYSIKVNSARLMSYNEYIEEYGQDEGNTVEGLDGQSVVCLEVEAKNVGNEDGAIFIFDCKLIPKRKNDYFMYARHLWEESEPNAKDAFHLRLAKDSEYTTFIPYKVNINDEENQIEYKQPITDASFEFIVSNAPVRKVIDVSLSD
ncbi:hypothetical protein C1876_05645 [Eggerthella sinensis]|uniref:DUF5028 domain-containing protein n=3 Tax=Eggerthella sinensis TaxID=242230 RepID=A0A3N0J0K2_9ACTN|nr:DUF5028 domain-containing protein [Eggerthella sinensis]RDB69875.1 hypothetical protein C1876_05645 [Eggerthella sinensis]RNM42763.1 hypothetical protein DMP09_03225 [Eggerthella sinensis]